MNDPQGNQVTHLLEALERGEDRAKSQLWDAVYDELRQIAGGLMVREAANHTLQPTALVHEAYARLVGGERVRVQDRGYFFRAAAQAMRRILIEHARKHIRRSGRPIHMTLDGLAAESGATNDQLEELDRALDELAEHDGRVYEVVMLRFFAGLGVEETAEILGTSSSSVKRWWAYGRTWLFQKLKDADRE